jgi:hypothetical protein
MLNLVINEHRSFAKTQRHTCFRIETVHQARKVAHDYNLTTPEEVEAGGSQVIGQSELTSEFKASLEYIARPCLKTLSTRAKSEGELMSTKQAGPDDSQLYSELLACRMWKDCSQASPRQKCKTLETLFIK